MCCLLREIDDSVDVKGHIYLRTTAQQNVYAEFDVTIIYVTRRSLPRYRESIWRRVINGRITSRIAAWTDFPCELLAPVVRHSFSIAHSEKLIVTNSVLSC